MIKFFRIIRQKLLSENKFTKYLLYSIGEIVLVVIGILIALQIGIWNNENQQKKLEIKYLKEIKNNLQSDLPDVNFNLRFNESKLESNKVILQLINREIPFSDSLGFHFSNLVFNTRTLVNASTYENLKSRGLEIISNDSLRQTITTLYEFDIHNLVDFETKDDHAFQYQTFIPEISKSLNFSELSLENGMLDGYAMPIDIDKIYQSNTLKNAIIININLREYMVLNYQEIKKKIEDTIDQIEIELILLEE